MSCQCGWSGGVAQVKRWGVEKHWWQTDGCDRVPPGELLRDTVRNSTAWSVRLLWPWRTAGAVPAVAGLVVPLPRTLQGSSASAWNEEQTGGYHSHSRWTQSVRSVLEKIPIHLKTFHEASACADAGLLGEHLEPTTESAEGKSLQSDDFNMVLQLFPTIYQIIKCTLRENKIYSCCIYSCPPHYTKQSTTSSNSH